MTNLECVIAILANHREARRWADEAVALDVLTGLGLDGASETTHAAGVAEAETSVVDDDPPARVDPMPDSEPPIEADPIPPHA